MSAKPQRCPICKAPITGHSTMTVNGGSVTVQYGDVKVIRPVPNQKRIVYSPCGHYEMRKG